VLGAGVGLGCSHIEADAALKSLRAELTPIDGDGDSDSDGSVADASAESPVLALAGPRSGPTPKRRACNATAVSRTDPDAKLRHKPGHRTHLVHRGQVAVDPKARVIVAVQAEQATASEADGLEAIMTRARFAGHTVAEVAADSGYASQDAYATLNRLANVRGQYAGGLGYDVPHRMPRALDPKLAGCQARVSTRIAIEPAATARRCQPLGREH
jgi:hypothetical protein